VTQRMQVVVPGVPVSVNVRWQPVGRKIWTRDGVKFAPTGIGMAKTREAKDFEQRIADHCFIAAIKHAWKCSDGSIAVGIGFFGGGVDIDNGIKGILDGLQKAHVFYNDGQVDELYVRRIRAERDHPRIEVEVWERDEAPITKKERQWSIT
jgi:Holliday junction resolvase RusA-like endonuclease